MTKIDLGKIVFDDRPILSRDSKPYTAIVTEEEAEQMYLENNSPCSSYVDIRDVKFDVKPSDLEIL